MLIPYREITSLNALRLQIFIHSTIQEKKLRFGKFLLGVHFLSIGFLCSNLRILRGVQC